MANQIYSKGNYNYDEAYAAEAGIYPGMLLEVDSDGKVKKHATEGGRCERLFAREDALQGNTVDTVYTSANIVSLLLPHVGSEVNVLVEDGQDISIGDELISAGNGKLKAASDLESGETLAQVVCRAMEACDLTGSGSSDTLCRARIV